MITTEEELRKLIRKRNERQKQRNERQKQRNEILKQQNEILKQIIENLKKSNSQTGTQPPDSP